MLASPLMVLLTGVAVAQQPPSGTFIEWGAFAYLAAVSMYLGFFAWYRGLAIGPMDQVSQVQLFQPVMSIAWSGLLLGEFIGWQTITGGIAVVACALLAVRARNNVPGNRNVSVASQKHLLKSNAARLVLRKAASLGSQKSRDIT